MAFTSVPSATLKYVLEDETGNIGFAVFHVPYATLATVAFTAADLLAVDIAAMTGCHVLSYSLTYSAEDNAPGTPAAGSRIEHKGRFLWQLANGLNSKTEIPGFLQSLVLSDGAIDSSALAVSTFISAIVNVGAIFCGADGSDITANNGAYEAFRRTTKRQLPTRRHAP